MAITTINNRSVNRSDTASSGQVWTATSATAADFSSSKWWCVTSKTSASN